MAINVVHAGDAGIFDVLCFPEQSQANMSYFQNQMTRFSETLSDVGRKFMETSVDIYNKIHNSDAARMARAALRSAKGIFHPNHIVPLESLEDLQAAQSMMQRYIMAQPDIRAMYHEQRCDGYSDTYVDIEPGKVGKAHYDYRRVMDGIVQEDGDDWCVNTWAEDLHNGDRELLFGEKVDVLNVWDIVSMFVHAGKDDPTSPYGGMLG